MRVRPQVGQAMRFTPPFPEARRLQNLLGCVDLLHRVGGQRHPDGVADAKAQEAPMPMADFTMPMEGVPASVTPRCRG